MTSPDPLVTTVTPEHGSPAGGARHGDHRSAGGGEGSGESLVAEALHRLGTDVHGVVKPLLRGRIHLGALVLAAPAGALLVASARTGTGRLAAGVYVATLLALFGASAAYHRLGRTVRTQRVLRRVDHATIYLLIAGSYTPFCLLGLPGAWRWGMLAVIWTSAVVGVVLKLALFEASSVIGAVLYIAMGWAAVVAGPVLVGQVSLAVLALLVTGGLLYTLGAVVLSRRWPDPAPRVFGYHEVWHSAVVVAVACHYAAIFLLVT
jgi:hemolysin III